MIFSSKSTAKGDVVALDAEFVSLGAQETEIREDGRLVIVNPAHFSLARVSVRDSFNLNLN